MHKDDNYTYRTFHVRKTSAPLYAESLRAFGWEYIGREKLLFSSNNLALSFRRKVTIDSDIEMQRLQRAFEIESGDVELIEENLNRKASSISILMGFIGVVMIFIALLVRLFDHTLFAISFLSLGVVLCVFSLFCYLLIVAFLSKKVEPVLKNHFDKIYIIKDQAYSLQNRVV